MDDSFVTKVRTAMMAGWWTILIAAVFLTMQWVVYLLVISTEPEWMLYFWGPGITWDDIQSIWLWAMVAAKIGLWFLILFTTWVTIWLRLLVKK